MEPSFYLKSMSHFRQNDLNKDQNQKAKSFISTISQHFHAGTDDESQAHSDYE